MTQSYRATQPTQSPRPARRSTAPASINPARAHPSLSDHPDHYHHHLAKRHRNRAPLRCDHVPLHPSLGSTLPSENGPTDRFVSVTVSIGLGNASARRYRGRGPEMPQPQPVIDMNTLYINRFIVYSYLVSLFYGARTRARWLFCFFVLFCRRRRRRRLDGYEQVVHV